MFRILVVTQNQQIDPNVKVSLRKLLSQKKSLVRPIENAPYSPGELRIYFRIFCNEIEEQLDQNIELESDDLELKIWEICKKISSKHTITASVLRKELDYWFKTWKIGTEDGRSQKKIPIRHIDVLDLVNEQSKIFKHICNELYYHNRSVDAQKIKKFCVENLDCVYK